MVDKIKARKRRGVKQRAKIKELKATRLCVNRSAAHIYGQVISPEGKVLASASTLEKAFKEKEGYGGNVAAAKAVGLLIAERAKKAGVTKVAFDRSGYRYHGRVKALADGAREGGIDF